MKTYYVQDTGWINGQHREKGEAVEMTEAQARYYVLEGSLAETKPAAAAPAPKKAKGE